MQNTKYKIRNTSHRGAFSLIEVVTAVGILALISSSVLVVVDRCMTSAVDSTLRMQAFEVARENMETLLSRDSVEEMVEYGYSERYPEIQWQTTVESFYEPLTSRMWVQAVCLAEYTDSAGDAQKVELTHWLTDLTKEQVLQLIEEQLREKDQLADQIIESAEEAAAYAGVDVETIEQWVENGMLKTSDGFFLKGQLDLYERTDGNPTVEDRKQQAQIDADLIEPTEQQGEQGEQDQIEDDGVERIGGRTFKELVQEGFPRQLLEQLFGDN